MPDASPLSALGLSAEQEQTYRALLRQPGLDRGALAAAVARDPAAVAAELARLAQLGLVELPDDRGDRGDQLLLPPPERALEGLIVEATRRLHGVGEQLDALRLMLPSLTAEQVSGGGPRGQPVTVELVDGGDVPELLRALSAASSGDLRWMRPDQWRLPPGTATDAWVREVVGAGRRSRALYPARALEEASDVIRLRAEAGEHVRILAEVPFRLAILGSSAALIPERLDVETECRLVLRHASLVGAMTLLFDVLWERAMAVPGLDGQGHDDEPVSDRRLLLEQLARGAKDEQIARALGLSLRTVRRRVADLMQELGADSRFHAGVEAVRRGLV